MYLLPWAILLLISAVEGLDPPSPFSPLAPRSVSRHTARRRHAGLRSDLWTTLRSVFRDRSRVSLQRRDQQVLDAGQKLYCAVPKQGDQSTDTSTTLSFQPTDGGHYSDGPTITSTASPETTHASSSTSSSSKSSTSTTSTSTPTSTTSTSTPTSTTSTTTTSSSTTTSAPTPSSSWKVTQSYTGSDFFGTWNWLTGPDSSTNGIVNYVDANTAKAAGLAYVNSQGNFVMGVETTGTVNGSRQSIRLQSQATYTGGLVVLDAVHMPTGCGTWPAFWSNGPGEWPLGGEIDIVEGVNDVTVNQVTLHTGQGCSLPSSDPNALGVAGSVTSTNCKSGDAADTGCGIIGYDQNSFGPGFNNKGGGMYAMKWDNSGISVWFFASGSVPGDLSGGVPKPESWGQPMASFPASTCSPFQYFQAQTMIFDTTLCGNLAGSSWTASGEAGQATSCAARTGFGTCEDFVRANGAAFAQAYWEVRSVKLYQTS